VHVRSLSRCPAEPSGPRRVALVCSPLGSGPGAYGKPGGGKGPCPFSCVRGQARPRDNQDNLR